MGVSIAQSLGLSPRTRGNHRLRAGEADIWGSIPANAGEPTSASSKGSSGGVYPRERGGTGCTARIRP